MSLTGHDGIRMMTPVLIGWLTVCHVTVSGLMLPFGTGQGDTEITTNRGSSPSLSLPSAFVFYQDTYTTAYVNSDGFVSFTWAGNQFGVNKDFDDPALTREVICVFCAAFRSGVLYRLSTAASDLQTIQGYARQYQDFGATFSPTWVIVVTWNQLSYPFQSSGQGNTMQVALATDGVKSLVFFDYEVISFVEPRATFTSVNTKVGFNKGDATNFYLFAESKSTALTGLPASTNLDPSSADSPGKYLFRVDEATVVAAPTKIVDVTTEAATTAASSAASATTTPASGGSGTTAVSESGGLSGSSQSDDDATVYYIVFGVLGALLLVVVVAVVAVLAYKNWSKASSGRQIDVRSAVNQGAPASSAADGVLQTYSSVL